MSGATSTAPSLPLGSLGGEGAPEEVDHRYDHERDDETPEPHHVEAPAEKDARCKRKERGHDRHKAERDDFRCVQTLQRITDELYDAVELEHRREDEHELRG